MAIEKFNLVFEWEKSISPEIKHLAFRREDAQVLDFEPGQFITFLFEVDGKVKRRSYSVATIPSQSDLIEIVLSYVPGGLASECLFNLKKGQCLPAMGPAGRLVLKDDDRKRYVFVGTGTGIGPYRAMLEDVVARQSRDPDFRCDIVLGVRTFGDEIFESDFIDFANQQDNIFYHVTYSREKLANPQSFQHEGYVQDLFDALALNPAQDAVYLCGNPNMIDQAFEDLKARGFEIGDIRREKYISS